MSQQETVSWISLLVSLVIAYLYFSRVLAMPADADLFSPGMAQFAISLVLFAVFAGIASEVSLKAIKHRARGPNATALDERDLLIDLKACRNAYGVLAGATCAVLLQVAMLEWLHRLGRHRAAPDTVLGLLRTGPLAPMHIVQLLLLALTLAGLTVYISRIVYYRRDA
jgi:hypothetical protein